MRDSTLSIILLFILGLVSICFYWSFHFFGPANAAPCSVHDAHLLLKQREQFKSHVIPEDARPEGFDDVDSVKMSLEQEHDGDDDESLKAGDKKKSKVKGILFPPDRVPIQYEVNESVWDKSVKEFKEHKSPMDFSRLHFVHVPKAGGTSFNILLRQMMCERDPEENRDCCEPGICYKKRRCDVMVRTGDDPGLLGSLMRL